VLLGSSHFSQLQEDKMGSKISRLLGDLGGGSISALIMLCYAVGYGLMIFSGSLERYVSVGIPSLLVGVCLVGFVVALWSSQQFRIAEPDSNTAAILAVSLASIGLDTRAKGGSESAVIVTVLMALTATLLVSGVVAYGLGRLHQGGLIQLAPFSVVGGGGLGHRLSISNTLFTCYKQIL
jgi:SulP family sulfate permease